MTADCGAGRRAKKRAAAPPPPLGSRAVGLEIAPVRSGKELKEFIRLPFRLYEGVEQWVPPLTASTPSLLLRGLGKLGCSPGLLIRGSRGFTGRLHARDVNDVIERIVKFNEIDDVSKIPVGYPVKIPMDLLLAEYRPKDDPTRLAREAVKRESGRVARRKRASATSSRCAWSGCCRQCGRETGIRHSSC